MRVVITGGPGTGKTSIIESLEKMNFNVFSESSREVTKKYKNNNFEQYFLSNPLDFSNILMGERKKQFEKGSKRKNTALREIYEETGIHQKNLNIIKLLIPTHDNIKDGKDVVIKKTYWYLVEHLGDAKAKLIPERREGITKCKWLTPSEIVLIMKDSRPLVHYLLEFVLQDPDYKSLRKTRGKIV